MPRISGWRTHVLRKTAWVAVIALAAITTAAVTATAQNTAVHLFNLNASRSFDVLKNGTTLATSNSTTNGSLRFAASAAATDQFRIFETGAGAAPPTAPTGLAASGDAIGCAHLTWNANPEPDVLFYRVYYGAAPAAYGDSSDVSARNLDLCGLADGTWYFAARTTNSAGLLSGLSNEVSASVSNGNAQPPLPPILVSASEGAPGCVDVSWAPSGDPNVVGYTVDYGRTSVAGGQSPQYDVSLPVGPVPGATLCSLPGGTWYVAVRARNYLGIFSAYSVEQTVTVTTTAVFITAFRARSESYSVHLEWEILADELVQGFRVRRSVVGVPGSEVLANPGDLLDPQSRQFIDRTIAGDTEYRYTLVVIGEDGREIPSPPATVKTNALGLFLDQNYPNPFNPMTSISFVMPTAGDIRLTVHDVRGALVATLADGPSAPGRQVILWEGTDDQGRRVASGAYFYRLQSPAGVRTRKMMLLK